jgi:hypothetical protein
MPRERFQHNERRVGRFTDQHGREWEASVENATGHPCGPLKPLFAAPVIPPDAYMVPHPVKPGVLTIDYDRWLAHVDANLASHQVRLEDAARVLYGKDASRYFKDPTPEMLRAVGGAPEPREPIVAALQGKSRWVLGLSHPDTGASLPMPAWAVPFFEPKARDSRSEFFDDTPAAELTDETDDDPDGDGRMADDFPRPEIFTGLQHEQAKALIRRCEDVAVLEAYDAAERARQPEPRPSVAAAIALRFEALAASV